MKGRAQKKGGILLKKKEPPKKKESLPNQKGGKFGGGAPKTRGISKAFRKKEGVSLLKKRVWATFEKKGGLLGVGK